MGDVIKFILNNVLFVTYRSFGLIMLCKNISKMYIKGAVVVAIVRKILGHNIAVGREGGGVA